MWLAVILVGAQTFVVTQLGVRLATRISELRRADEFVWSAARKQRKGGCEVTPFRWMASPLSVPSARTVRGAEATRRPGWHWSAETIRG
jgi:hypothetical protein